MRKVIDTNAYDWEVREVLQNLLDIRIIPRFIIIETVEED